MASITGFDILIQMFAQIDVLMLIFVRVLAFFLVLPVISSQNIWMIGRLFFALCTTIVIFLSGSVEVVYYMDTTLGFVYVMLLEFLVGLAMGYVLFLVFNLIFFSGQLIDFQIGLMMVNVMDPMTQVQVPVTGNLFYFSMIALLVVTGGLNGFLLTFFYSYTILPIGTAFVVGNAPLAWYLIILITESTFLAIRIALPVVGTMLIVDASLGIMVKTVPQMNIFVVGLPLKLFLGLIIIFTVMVPNLGVMHEHIFDMALMAIRETMMGMVPTQ
ncbi:MAG: flagellar biosynthetic protein FliR [Defluviitaleaceae bacterium]|nr:flagellar biosynthetic protein FliR [Defluviitaleaceae bacterium]